MVSVMMPEAGVRELISRWGGQLSVAAVNGPAQVVVSGPRLALAEFGAELSARHIMRWPVPDTDFIAHSARAGELAGPLTAALGTIRPAVGHARLYSTVTGRWMDGPDLDARYWYANLRQTVQFAVAVRDLAGLGYTTFIEVSPHPVLEAAVADTIADAGLVPAPLICGTLHRDTSGGVQVLTTLARIFARGISVDWLAVLGNGHMIELPTYAFQHQRYWFTPRPRHGTGPGTAEAGAVAEARFWAAVEGQDVVGLAAALAVEDRKLGEVLPALAAWRRREQDTSVTAAWRYRVSWVPVADPGPGLVTGTWLLVTLQDTAGELAPAAPRYAPLRSPPRTWAAPD
jgi:acyl transferase domain-containing protein